MKNCINGSQCHSHNVRQAENHWATVKASSPLNCEEEKSWDRGRAGCSAVASVAQGDRNSTVQPEKTLLKSARALLLVLRPAPATAGAPPAFV